MAQTLTVGDRVTIIGEHNKGKSGVVHQVRKTQACCWIEDTMYLWYPLLELENNDSPSLPCPLSPSGAKPKYHEAIASYLVHNPNPPTPWDIYPIAWESQGVDCSYDGDYLVWGGHIFKVTSYLKETYINPGTLLNFLEDSFEHIQQITALLVEPMTAKAILSETAKLNASVTGLKQTQVSEALELGVDLELFCKEGKFYKLVNSQESIVDSSGLIVQPPIPNTQYPIPNTMTFQFPQTQAIATELTQLQERINQLTATLQPYKEFEDRCNDLLDQVNEHAHLMRCKNIDEQAITQWANSLYNQVSGVEIEPSQAVKTLQKENDSLRAEITQLEQEHNKTVSSLQEDILAISAKCEELRKEKNEADTKIGELFTSNGELIASISELKALEQERGTKENADQWFTNLQSDLKLAQQEREAAQELVQQERETVKRLTKRMELLDRDNRGFLERIGQLQSQLESAQKPAQKQFTVGDTVTTKAGDEGMVIGFVYENVMVELPNGRFNFRHNDLTKIDDETTEELKNLTTEIVKDESSVATDLEVGDIVQRPDAQVGTVVYVPNPFNGVVSVDYLDGKVNTPASQLKFISRPENPVQPISVSEEVKAQIRAQDFLGGIKKASDVEAIAWSDIAEICQENPKIITEIALNAKSKAQKNLVEKIPDLLAKCIDKSGDRSPLDWVGDSLKKKVENILNTAPF